MFERVGRADCSILKLRGQRPQVIGGGNNRKNQQRYTAEQQETAQAGNAARVACDAARGYRRQGQQQPEKIKQ